jgi:hypothetical protein
MTTFAILRERSDLISNPQDTARRSRLQGFTRSGRSPVPPPSKYAHALLDDTLEHQVQSEELHTDIDNLTQEIASLRRRATELMASNAYRDRTRILYHKDDPMEVDVYSHSIRHGVDAADFVAVSGECHAVQAQLANYRTVLHRKSIEELLDEIECGAREVYELSA